MAERITIYRGTLERILEDYRALAEERYARINSSDATYKDKVKAFNERRKALMDINRIKRQMK